MWNNRVCVAVVQVEIDWKESVGHAARNGARSKA
jgi:hypothetical protein